MIISDLLILVCAVQSFLLLFLYVELRAAKEAVRTARPLVKDLVELCHSLAELARSGKSEPSEEPEEQPKEDPS